MGGGDSGDPRGNGDNRWNYNEYKDYIDDVQENSEVFREYMLDHYTAAIDEHGWGMGLKGNVPVEGGEDAPEN